MGIDHNSGVPNGCLLVGLAAPARSGKDTVARHREDRTLLNDGSLTELYFKIDALIHIVMATSV